MKRTTLVALLLLVCATLSATPRILAHRGGRMEQEENTLTAFRNTYDAGCHGFETDIHFDADKDLVIIHDYSLERMTNGRGTVEKSSTQYIKSLKTKGGNPVLFLDELVDYFQGCRTLYVEWELKTNPELYPTEVLEEYCDKVYASIMPKKPADALYIFSSFDERPLVYMKNKYPEVEVMLIASKPCTPQFIDHCLEIGVHRCACSVNSTNRDGVRYAHRNDVLVNLWPGNTVQDTELAAMLEADYLCTDYPVKVMEYIKDHNLDISSEGFAPHPKKLVCMDLDGTLTQHKTALSKEVKKALDALGKKYHLLVVGGGSATRIHDQMNGYPIDILGNYGMQEARVQNGKWTIVREETTPVDTVTILAKCNALREKYGYNEYYGESVEFQKSGMITFGLLGTKAPSEEKLAFDPDKKKRRLMYQTVCRTFPDYSVFIGGTTSFDLAGKQYNKYDAIMRYAAENGYSKEEIIFIGDDLGEGGNDSHVRLGGIECIRISDFATFPVMVKPLLEN